MGLFGKWFGSDRPARASEAPAPAVDPAVVSAALLDEIRAQGVTGDARVEGNYLFIDEAGTTRHVFLGNLAREYADAAPAARRGVVARYARLAARPIGLASPDLRTRLLPKLTPRKERAGLRTAGVHNLLAGRPLANGALSLELAVDERESVRLVTESDLAGCKLSEDEAYVHALTNLRQRSTGRWEELAPGLLQSPWGDYFDGARLALPTLVRGLPIRGKPIAVVPNRCVLLVTGSEEPAGLGVLVRATRMFMEKDRPVHVAPLVLDGEQWRAIDPGADFDAVAMAPSLLFLRSLQASLDLAACSEQVKAQLLAQGYRAVGDFGRLQGEDVVQTMAQCPAGDGVVLPKTDIVAFSDDVLVFWSKLEVILGADLVRLDVWPPHYEMKRRPTAEELEAVRIRARASPPA